jgi:hypothetical protein
MSEAGKEILLREALANHMRSTRDRKMFSTILEEPRPLQEILSFFASYYLYNYSGIRLLTLDETSGMSIEEKDELTKKERHQLELEISDLLGSKFSEELIGSKLSSEFIIQFCEELGSGDPYDPSVLDRTKELIRDYLSRIPNDFSGVVDIDFINSVTGWAKDSRMDLYNKASGLKETAMSLRDELLREHDFEVIEISILKQGLKNTFGLLHYSDSRLIKFNLSENIWNELATATARNLLVKPDELPAIIRANRIKVRIFDSLQSEITKPTTIEQFENKISQFITKEIAESLKESPDESYLVLCYLFDLDSHELKSNLSRNGIRSAEDLFTGLDSLQRESKISTAKTSNEPKLSAAELDHVERSLKSIDKLEHTLEKPVKGMLKAKGLNPSELDKIDISILTKDSSSLLGIEVTVLKELKEKVRVPDPEEVKRLLEIREKMKRGEYGDMKASSGVDMSLQRQQAANIETLKFDFAWHFMISVFTNLTRVVEIYLRSKQDLLRIKALLKSIYEGTEPELQHLREEILIDVTSNRIYEMKCVFPELDAASICTWMHARLSSVNLDTARRDLESSSSPVFEGIADIPLKLDGLEFDNYAIAYDLMHRFLTQERKKLDTKAEIVSAARREEQAIISEKREQIDVISWIDTKAHTVFRAIGRVSSKGIEWSKNDDIKCSNLLSFYVKVNRGRQICNACGDAAQNGECPRHGRGNIINADDLTNLAIFLMKAITSIKVGLIGKTAEPMSWDESRSIIQREMNALKRKGKITSKTNLKELLPGEINQIVGPAIAAVVGKYFNESLVYASRRVGIA